MALCAFNVFNRDSMLALVQASQATGLPAYMQFSVSTVKYMGIREIVREFEIIGKGSQLILHLDHCNDVDFIKNCIDCGWNSVMADFSDLPIESNIKNLNLIRDYMGSSQGLIEAEVGSILGQEDGHGSVSVAKADVADVIRLAKEAEVDLVAVGIGNAHGNYNDLNTVDYDHFIRIHKSVPDLRLVLHGASGLPLFEIQRLKLYGLHKVNISTELKELYVNTIAHLLEGSQKFQMTKYSEIPIKKMKSYFEKKMIEIA